MVGQTLWALCILAAGLRVQSLPTSVPSPVSLPAKTTPSTVPWTSSPQSPPASPTSGAPSSSLPLVTASTQTSPHLKNVSTTLREETTSLVTQQEVTSTNPSSTSSGVHLTTSPVEHSSGAPEANVTTPGAQSPSETPTLTSPQAPASSASPLSTTSPAVSSTSVSSNHSTPDNNTQPTGGPTSPEPTTQEHSSGATPSPQIPAETVPTTETTPQTTTPVVVTSLREEIQVTTTSPGVIMQEVEHALSSGSIAAITVTVIAVVLLVFGVAAYLKIRHSSYGRLLDDHDYGSWGNYNNPLYDDS
ncbi:prostate androgen-regulated mucin-like protein 1 [Sorex fumeus]|uniref:prostate androgen-regulated mucin-like protein 1 n=1 Tax=Sorex fumeus TaxID=62283 RepID=UPI0024ACE813|nr:prostate androgen-regulated mucin-like protein 1 [Sorex fumeus]